MDQSSEPSPSPMGLGAGLARVMLGPLACHSAHKVACSCIPQAAASILLTSRGPVLPDSPTVQQIHYLAPERGRATSPPLIMHASLQGCALPSLMGTPGAPPSLWIRLDSRINPLTPTVLGHTPHLTAATVRCRRGDRHPPLHTMHASLKEIALPSPSGRPQEHQPTCGLGSLLFFPTELCPIQDVPHTSQSCSDTISAAVHHLDVSLLRLTASVWKVTLSFLIGTIV